MSPELYYNIKLLIEVHKIKLFELLSQVNSDRWNNTSIYYSLDKINADYTIDLGDYFFKFTVSGNGTGALEYVYITSDIVETISYRSIIRVNSTLKSVTHISNFNVQGMEHCVNVIEKKVSKVHSSEEYILKSSNESVSSGTFPELLEKSKYFNLSLLYDIPNAKEIKLMYDITKMLTPDIWLNLYNPLIQDISLMDLSKIELPNDTKYRSFLASFENAKKEHSYKCAFIENGILYYQLYTYEITVLKVNCENQLKVFNTKYVGRLNLRFEASVLNGIEYVKDKVLDLYYPVHASQMMHCINGNINNIYSIKV